MNGAARMALRPWHWLAAFAAWLVATAWLRPLNVPDEGRYVGVAWEMLRGGDWLVPTLNSLPYFHKPPLFYWLTAASLDWAGLTPLAARVAPLSGAILAGGALFVFARRWAGESTAKAALLALGTQPLFYVAAQYANLDMLVAGCIAATILALADAALGAQDSVPRRSSLLAAYLLAALGVLAKGLIGAVLPALVIGAWLLAERRFRLLLRMLWLPGIALFLAVASPWFIAMQLRFPEFAHYFFIVQHFQRFAESGFNNAQPWWFLVVVVMLACLPWSLWIVPATRRSYWLDGDRGAVRRMMWLWLFAITLFFSLPQSKLVGYILPVTVPLAFLAADAALLARAKSAMVRKAWGASLGAAVLACLAIAAYAAFWTAYPQRDIALELRERFEPGDRIVFLGEYYFAVPFYARLQRPVIMATDWAGAVADRRDNWRKEVLDAAQFAPDAKALFAEADEQATFCGAAPTWVIGSRHGEELRGWPAGTREVAASGDLVLWLVPGAGADNAALAACKAAPVLKSRP